MIDYVYIFVNISTTVFYRNNYRELRKRFAILEIAKLLKCFVSITFLWGTSGVLIKILFGSDKKTPVVLEFENYNKSINAKNKSNCQFVH